MRDVRDSKGILGIFGNFDDIEDGLNFFGKEEDYIQVGTFKYDEGQVLRNHRHLWRRASSTIKTQEVLILWKGKLELRVFDGHDNVVIRTIMRPGDFFISYRGGVGYTCLEPSVMMEVKSGQFPGSDEDRVLISEE